MTIKWALSNIMWGDVEDTPYLRLASDLGFEGVELALGVLSPVPTEITSDQARKIADHYQSFGLQIVSLQALLYERADLKVFGKTPEEENETRDYLLKLGQIAHELECPIMVLGSGKNRSRGILSKTEADKRAVSFFRKLSELLEPYGLVLCIEPLAESEADYINNHMEAIVLCEKVDHPCFRMILDAKSMALAKEVPDKAIGKSISWLRHFHVNDPGLTVPMSTGEVDHSLIGDALHRYGYNEFVSLEVGLANGIPRDNIIQSQQVLKQYY